MSFALWANYKVDLVSFIAITCGLTLQIITVLELPPKESFSKYVNFESLYLICLLLILFYSEQRSAKSLITAPRVVRLLLIILASFNLYPSAPVSLDLSLPAKSTMWNLDVFVIV